MLSLGRLITGRTCISGFPSVEARPAFFKIPYGSSPNTCPVRALQAWLEAAISPARELNRHGPILPGRLSDKAVVCAVWAVYIEMDELERRLSGLGTVPN
jgi:hypothetical protein